MKTLTLYIVLVFLSTNSFGQMSSTFLLGEWMVERTTESFPGKRMNSKHTYHFMIDSTGSMKSAGAVDHGVGQWIHPAGDRHCRMKWKYDVHKYTVDSISQDYIEISYTHNFHEPKEKYKPNPIGTDPVYPHKGHKELPVNMMEEKLVFRRVN